MIMNVQNNGTNRWWDWKRTRWQSASDGGYHVHLLLLLLFHFFFHSHHALLWCSLVLIDFVASANFHFKLTRLRKRQKLALNRCTLTYVTFVCRCSRPGPSKSRAQCSKSINSVVVLWSIIDRSMMIERVDRTTTANNNLARSISIRRQSASQLRHLQTRMQWRESKSRFQWIDEEDSTGN